VAEALHAAGIDIAVLHLGLEDAFIEHGDPARLLAMQGLDACGHCRRPSAALCKPAGARGARGLSAAQVLQKPEDR
jgi:1-deoxy-D-xylulose-5-phosphate synthase